MAKTQNKTNTAEQVANPLDKMTPAERLETLKGTHGSISNVIRHLRQTMSRGETAKYIGRKYQQVRQVDLAQLKKAAPAETAATA